MEEGGFVSELNPHLEIFIFFSVAIVVWASILITRDRWGGARELERMAIAGSEPPPMKMLKKKKKKSAPSKVE